MQQMLLAVDEQDSPHHAALAEADDLHGMPVVVADLHSALPAVLAGIRAVRAAGPGRLRHDRRRCAARGLLAAVAGLRMPGGWPPRSPSGRRSAATTRR